jgi:hypothetical protein
MPTGRMGDADRKGRCRSSWSMPTRRVVDATRNSDTYGKRLERQTIRSPEKPEVRKTPERRTVGGPARPESTGTPNSRNTDSIRNTGVSTHPEDAETPKSRNFRPVGKHWKFDLSGRYLETSTSGRRRVGGRCEIGNRIGCPVNETKTGSQNRKKLWQTQVRRGAKRNQSRRAEEPKEPQVELEGEC